MAECIDCGAVLHYGEEFDEKVCLSCQNSDIWRARLSWQEAALKLRGRLFREHQSQITETNWREHETKAGSSGTIEGSCETCRLLTETRWCMQPLDKAEAF